MDKLTDILWPIVLVGGLGAFIDFLIGKAGQERAKDFLLKWWVRFDDVRWNNFGREEGLFAGRFIERWFGRRIWSIRRIVAGFALFILILPIAYLLSFTKTNNVSCYYCHYPAVVMNGHNQDAFIYAAIYTETGLQSIFYFCGSISFLRFITFKMANACGVGERRNLFLFLLVLIINCLMLIYVSPFFAGERETLLATMFLGPGHFNPNETLSRNSYSLNSYLKRGEIDRTALFLLACFPSLIRFGLSFVFVGSFLLRPLVMRPLSFIWARIVESEKPVFTLIFGGAGAFATAIGEAAKHL
jgi:hypothetical protein